MQLDRVRGDSGSTKRDLAGHSPLDVLEEWLVRSRLGGCTDAEPPKRVRDFQGGARARSAPPLLRSEVDGSGTLTNVCVYAAGRSHRDR